MIWIQLSLICLVVSGTLGKPITSSTPTPTPSASVTSSVPAEIAPPLLLGEPEKTSDNSQSQGVAKVNIY